jgi:hypothetical protein
MRLDAVKNISEYLCQVITDRDEQLKIMERLHFGGAKDGLKVSSCHPGSRQFTYMVTSKFYWPGISQDIKRFVNSCERCQTRSVNQVQKVRQELIPVPVPFGKPWSQIGVDLMQLREEDGFNYIMTAVCYWTKWVEMAPIKRKAAEDVAVVLWQWMQRHGACDIQITDQGGEFNNHLSAELTRRSGIQH